MIRGLLMRYTDDGRAVVNTGTKPMEWRASVKLLASST